MNIRILGAKDVAPISENLYAKGVKTREGRYTHRRTTIFILWSIAKLITINDGRSDQALSMCSESTRTSENLNAKGLSTHEQKYGHTDALSSPLYGVSSFEKRLELLPTLLSITKC
jgi:hypothetical protein